MIIGVTGSFGSGKSTVARMLARKMQCGVTDADREAAKVLSRNRARISRLFGTADRGKLAGIVFSDRKNLTKLQKIIHPGVMAAVQRGAKKRKNLVLDVPLLFEAGYQGMCDYVVVVRCSEEERIKRLSKKFTRDEIRLRTARQWPPGKKVRRADFVVDNESLEETEKQVEEIWEKIKQW